MGTPADSASASGEACAETLAPAAQEQRLTDIGRDGLDVLRHAAHGANARLEALLHGVAVGVLFVGREGRVDLVNRSFCRMLGVASAGELVGQPGGAVAHRLSDRFADPAAFARQGLLGGGGRLALADGRVLSRELLPVGDGEAHGMLVLLREVSPSVESAAEVEPLHTVSHVDELTGLPNRRGFLAQAGRRLRRAAQQGRWSTLLCVDVEGTRTINARLGHTAGDRALEEVAGLLRLAFGDSDLVGRLGGDEFAVLALDVTEAQQPEMLARLAREVALLNARPARSWRLSLGVGTACFDAVHRPMVEDLLALADARLHAWKRARPGRGD